MGRNHIISLLQQLNFPKDMYVVTMGAVLSVNNIRPAGDIDIIFDPKIEGILREKGFRYEPKSDKKGFETRYVAGPIEAFTAFYNVGTFRDCIDTYRLEMIEGIPCMRLEDTLTLKKKFGRVKDLADCTRG
jgi:hypothetical protein